MSDLGEPGPTATSDVVAGTQWRIVSIGGQAVLDGDPLLVTFGHDGRVSGTTGVNRFTASYTITADYLSIGPLATTRRAGSPELMSQEQRLVGSLAGTCGFELDSRSLAIDGPLGRTELVNTTDPPPAELDQR